MATSRNAAGAADALKEQFRSSLDHLAGTMPLSAASISIRPVENGPLEPLATIGFDAPGPGDLAVRGKTPGVDLPPLVIGDAAVQWFEANRKELVLAIRPDHIRSEFYRPFTRHGLKTVLIVPVFRADALVGAVAVGSIERDAYGKRHLKLVELLAAELAGEFPAPAPAPRVAPAAEAARETAPPAHAPPPADAHIEADALGRVAAWDARAESLFGIPQKEAVGNVVTLCCRPKGKRLIEAKRLGELLATGSFRGRALCYDSDGRPVTCEVELSEIRTPAGARGFRGRFRRVESETLLPREEIQFDFAKLYAFANPVKAK